MSCHGFSLDPRTILGVGPSASPDEIREAYHAKSKKYHPDAGGDEWAFRMVARAYEVLKTTETARYSQPWAQGAPGGAARNEGEPDDSASQEAAQHRAKPDELGTVNVELVWTRYERGALAPFSSSQETDETTLSVCMVISWPPHSLLDRAAEFPASGETLHALIELLEQLRTGGSVVAARSRIEDGRFVAWLSYPDVPAAGDAFHFLRETLQSHGLTARLQTRDVVLPLDEDDAVVVDKVPAHSS
jgi:curved DNA-binding protein CbpA